MNWHLFAYLTENFSFTYWIIFFVIDLMAIYLKSHYLYMPEKHEDNYWKVVALYRSLRYPRKFMFLFWVVSVSLSGQYDGWHFWGILLFAQIAFFDKDDHGDDDRDKKPSKIKAAIKSLGHRLVVVPSGGN
jgi:hypothetical protein